MTVGRPLRATTLAAAWSVVAAPSPAQLTGTLEAAVSRVHYDDFLPSDALSLGTAFAAQNRTLAFGARGSFLRFESGNSTWQTTVTGSVMVPRLGPTRPEIWAAGGGSRYVDYPAFWHAFGGTRLHFDLDQGTAWVDGSVGRTSFGDERRPVTTIGAGAWTRRLGATMTIAASYVEVGETTYTDLQGTARREYRAIEVDGVLGARLWSNGGGEGARGGR